jgi:2-keto-4-pentenoate hydratase/2-oxohepta-3-ene-1,7-dioic acid hydratase in catechol pathway
VTADEIGDPQKLAMELRVNGELRNSLARVANISEMLSLYSAMSYSAGDLVSTGAASTGDAKTGYLKVGDVMECEIESIGILRNRIVSWEEAYGHKAPARATQETFP